MKVKDASCLSTTPQRHTGSTEVNLSAFKIYALGGSE